MKKSDLTKEQKEELEKFGANTWFVEELYRQYRENPGKVPEQWKNFFGGVASDVKKKNGGSENLIIPSNISFPQPGDNDEVQVIAGSAARILENMTNSLTVPVATSQRTIPVKLLEENRTLINNYGKKKFFGKLSFTHLIAWAIVRAIQAVPVMNFAYSVLNGKPSVIKRFDVNLGLAIDIEKKDGSHSLIVPNIKNVNRIDL